MPDTPRFGAPGSRSDPKTHVPGANPKAGGVQIAANPGSPCLISYPSASVPLVGTVGGGCVLSKTNVRAMVGGLLIGGGAILFLGGVVVLVAAGFRKSGAASKISGAVGFIPGVGPVAGAAISTVGGNPRRPRTPARPRVTDRESQLGEPRENPGLRVGRGAVRETPAGTRRRRAETGGGPPASRAETGY